MRDSTRATALVRPAHAMRGAMRPVALPAQPSASHRVRSPGASAAKSCRPMSEFPYVVILAGGEGQRLAPLTRALYGTDLPKQFAVLAGERSLMQTTIE